MSFLAKLFLDGTERKILNANILVQQAMDMYQRPTSEPTGGLITVVIESNRDNIFLEWMLNPTMMKNGYIRFYNRDGMSKFADLEFWDCYCSDFQETFSSTSSSPMQTRLTLTPGVLRFRDKVFEKHWKITDLAMEEAEVITFMGHQEEEEVEEQQGEPELKALYFTDLEGETLDELYPGEVYLVVESQNAIGETVTFDLNDPIYNYVYKGQELENDILSGYEIMDNIDKLKLLVKTEV